MHIKGVVRSDSFQGVGGGGGGTCLTILIEIAPPFSVFVTTISADNLI